MEHPMTLDRRRFLQGVGAAAGAAALGACSATTTGADPSNRTSGSTRGQDTTVPTAPVEGAGRPTLVIVTLSGGNDALNTVAPVNDDRYRSLRGSLALDPDAAHDVGEGFALHPSLTRTKALWDRGQLAIVHGVGFAELDRSHFHCMDVWQAADLTTTSGWIGRWLDADGDDPLDAITVGRRLPLLARGERRAAAAVPTGPFTLPGDTTLRADLRALASADPARSPLAEAVSRSNADLLTVEGTVSPVVAGSSAEPDDLSARLTTIASLIEADLATRVYATELGGFDTHAGQLAQQAALLDELDAALGAFLDRTGDRSVTVLVYSEFGRRVVPNASAGTDHGRAGAVLVAGRVDPGHFGDPPPLDDLVEGDLRTTVDYRSVYGGLLEGVLAMPVGDVIDDAPVPLALV